MDMTTMKENIFIHRSLEAGGQACHAGPHEKVQGLVRRQKESKEKV